MFFLIPLNLLLSVAVSIPIIIHLRRKFHRKEIIFPAAFLLVDKKIKKSKILRFHNIIQLIIRILIILILTLIFSGIFLKNNFPFSKIYSDNTLVVDVSPSMEIEKNIEKFKPLEDISSLFSKILIVGDKNCLEIENDSFFSYLENYSLENKVSANIMVPVLYSQENNNFFIFSDNQDIFWNNYNNNYNNIFSINSHIQGKKFALKNIISPSWWFSGDSVFFLVEVFDSTSLKVKYENYEETYPIKDKTFISIFLKNDTLKNEILFIFPGDTIIVDIESNNNFSFYSNDLEILNSIVNLIPDSIYSISLLPESANFIFISENKQLPNLDKISDNSKIFIFLEDGKKLSSFLFNNYRIIVENRVDSALKISFGINQLKGVWAWNINKIISESENLSNFENSYPALINNKNLYVFPFCYDNSTLKWHWGFIELIYQEMFNNLSEPRINPDISIEERSNIYYNSLDSFNILSLNIDQVKKTALENIYFDNKRFLLIILLVLILLDGLLIKTKKSS